MFKKVMRNLFLIFSFIVFTTLSSCKKCETCSNLCFSCSGTIIICSTDYGSFERYFEAKTSIYSSNISCKDTLPSKIDEACSATRRIVLEELNYVCGEP